MLNVETVDSIERLDGLRTAWELLATEAGAAAPFLSLDWFLCCLEAYGADKRCRVLVVREGQRIVGIAPLWLGRSRRRGFTVNVLGFIDGPDTPRVDFLIAEADREATLRTLLHHLYGETRAEWDVVELGRWPGESANLQMFRDLLADESKHVLMDTSSELPSITLDGSWEKFLERCSAKFRKTCRNIVNRMGRLENVEVELCRVDPDGSLVDAVISVSDRSWKKAEGISLGCHADVERFFRRWTAVAGTRRWLHVWLVRVQGEPVAMEYDVECDGVVYALRADYDERFAEYSPGAYLQQRILQHLFESGARLYNTGPGLKAYKMQTADQVAENKRMSIFNHNVKGRALWAVESTLVPSMRKVKQAMSSGE